jgi:glucokinase
MPIERNISAIGIDLGGTRIKGVALHRGEVTNHVYLPTGEGGTFKQNMLNVFEELRNKIPSPEVVVGISAPGIPNEKNNAIAVMPGRLPGLEGFVWTDFFKTPTWVLNDAVCALVAEAKLGVAKNYKNAVMLTLGTGVGGAILIDGKPYQGSFNKAGHWGHTTVDFDGFADVTNMPGSIEEAIGNVSIERRSIGQFRSTQDVLNALEDNDPFAHWIWLSSVQKISLTISSISNALSPELVILGGGIAEAGDWLFTPLKRFMDVYEWRPGGNGVEIVKAKFSDLAGAIGAACYALDRETG